MTLWPEALAILAGVITAASLIRRWVVTLESKPEGAQAPSGLFLGIDFNRSMGAWEYLTALFIMTVMGGLLVFIAGLTQAWLPLNPAHATNLSPLWAGHIAVSAATHTNWQAYVPQTALSVFTQMLVIGVQNTLAGAIGYAVWRALVRALARKDLGNAWRAIANAAVGVLLPLQLIFALFLVAQGVPQNPFAGDVAKGPVASFTAASITAGAGAGYFDSNFASSLANPNALTNYAGIIALIALPLGLLLAAGDLVKKPRLGEALTLATIVLLAVTTALAIPKVQAADRYSPLSKAVYLSATAGSSNGSQNAPLEHFTPAQRLPAFLTILAGLPLPAAVGVGVGYVFCYLMVAIYLAALMVGRSPKFMGFGLNLPIVRLVAFTLLVPQLIILIGAGYLILSPEGLAMLKAQSHAGAAAILWAVGSWVQNNGSAFSLTLDAPIFLKAAMVLMTVGRFLALGPLVLLAGEFFKQRDLPEQHTVIELHSPTIIVFWVAVLIIGGLLAMLPVMMLGPVVEALL